MVFPLVLVAIAIIALAIYYWYITLSIIIIIVIWWNWESISKGFHHRKKNNSSKKSNTFKQAYYSNRPLKWNITSKCNISEYEAQQIFGADWKSLDTAESLYARINIIGFDEKKIRSFEKNILRKLPHIFQDIYEQYLYEAFVLEVITPTEEKIIIERKMTRIIQNCKQIFDKCFQKKSSDNQSQESKHQKYKRQEYKQKKKTYQNSGKKSKSKSKSSQSRTKRVEDRLKKFQITPSDAQIIFGRTWRSKLGKPEWEFYYTIRFIEIDFEFDYNNRCRKKYGHLYSKVLQIIQIVMDENADMREEEGKQRNKYSQYSYNDHNWDDEYDYNNYHEDSDIDEKDITKAFEIFGLTRASTKSQIKTKYRELTLKFHPDKNKSKNSTVKMTEINKAYELIMSIMPYFFLNKF